MALNDICLSRVLRANCCTHLLWPLRIVQDGEIRCSFFGGAILYAHTSADHSQRPLTHALRCSCACRSRGYFLVPPGCTLSVREAVTPMEAASLVSEWASDSKRQRQKQIQANTIYWLFDLAIRWKVVGTVQVMYSSQNPSGVPRWNPLLKKHFYSPKLRTGPNLWNQQACPGIVTHTDICWNSFKNNKQCKLLE